MRTLIDINFSEENYKAIEQQLKLMKEIELIR